MSQPVFGIQHKLHASHRLGYTPNTHVAVTAAAGESPTDAAEVVPGKNLPENGAIRCRNVAVHIEEGRMVFGAAESRVNSPPARRKRHRARKKADLSHSPDGDTKSTSAGESSDSSPGPASAPLAPDVDVRLHAHTRTCTRSAPRVDVIRCHTPA